MHRLFLLLALPLVSTLSVDPAAADPWQGKSAAFFGLVWIDTSLEGETSGPRADETERLAENRDYVAGELEAHGLTLVDLAPVADELDRIASPADCYGCDARMAKRLGADYAIVGEVQKVSNLILSMNIVVRDAETGKEIRARSVDIRGNTDESWRRGMRYILEHGIFTD